MSFDLFPSKQSLTDSSKKLYTGNLTKLNNKNEIKDLKFLLNSDDIDKKLAEIKTDNTRRTYLIAIVSCLKGRENKKEKDAYKRYYEQMMCLNKDLKNNTVKTDKQVDNWISQDDVETIFNNNYKTVLNEIEKCKKIDESDYNKLLDLVILGLYVTAPPRRILDYLKMLVIKSPHTDSQFNYLDTENNRYIFNNYKTAGTYKQVVENIPDDYTKILKLFFKFHPLSKQMKKKDSAVPFLVKYDGTPLNQSNQITRILNRIFGKKISVSMLRNIYLSSKYGDMMNEMKNDAKMMATSVSTATNNYIKE
jgi:hypothetical protein